MSEYTNVVVDAWLQPWLYRGDDALRIWIESSVVTRLMKASVTVLRRGEAVPSDLRINLARKMNSLVCISTSLDFHVLLMLRWMGLRGGHDDLRLCFGGDRHEPR